MKKKKGLGIVGIVLLIVALMFVGYVIYLFATYYRIDDKVEVEISQADEANKLQIGEEISVLAYNVGFGAYSADYSFFMDGGKYSRAYSKEAVKKNIGQDITVLQEYDPDIILLQEVDKYSTRSHHVDEVSLFHQSLPEYSTNFALNYHSAYLLYPFSEPHGASNSGILTMSKYEMTSALRRSLPISESVFKFLDLDRCYVITRIPTNNGKELVLFNVHLSAYTVEDDLVSRQIAMLAEDMEKEYKAGNYIICGGDFNQDMLGNSAKIFGTETVSQSWAVPFPTEKLPEGIKVMTEYMTEEEIYELVPSCRNADSPYIENESFVTFVDGFLISDNVAFESFETIDTGFATSDHNPIILKVVLQGE